MKFEVCLEFIVTRPVLVFLTTVENFGVVFGGFRSGSKVIPAVAPMCGGIHHVERGVCQAVSAQFAWSWKRSCFGVRGLKRPAWGVSARAEVDAVFIEDVGGVLHSVNSSIVTNQHHTPALFCLTSIVVTRRR